MRILSVDDWKTGTFVAPEYRLQLAAYWGATHVFEPDAMTWLPIRPEERATQGRIVQVRPEGTKTVLTMTLADLESAFVQFDHAFQLFTYFENRGLWTIPTREEYRVRDRQFVSVTYILSHIIAKPGLLQWYAKMAKEGKVPEEERDKRAVAGSTIHKNILFFLEGKQVDLTQAPLEVSQTITNFALWSQREKLEPVWTERKVCHMDLGYAGTLDSLNWTQENHQDTTDPMKEGVSITQADNMEERHELLE